MTLAAYVKQGLLDLNRPELFQVTGIQERIIQYLLLIEKWNKIYNLTAIKTIEAMCYQHVMDSLAVAEHINGSKIVDVGTGAGLPGIPLAIVRPDWEIILVESNHKKTTFLQQVKIELELVNISIVTERIESLQLHTQINAIISRAYASLGTFVKTTCHLVARSNTQCRWLAMKSQCTDPELGEIVQPFYIEDRIPLAVPGLTAKRELIIIGQLAQSTEGSQQ